jgi:hypothetical protein
MATETRGERWKLPRVLSKLLRLALKDLRVVENMPGVQVCMGVWHDYNNRNKVCSMCLAGAVMAQTLKVKTTHSCTPDSFEVNKLALEAVDYLRTGNVKSACEILDIDTEKLPEHLWNVVIPSYPRLHEDWPDDVNPDMIPTSYRMKQKAFHSALKKLATKLKRVRF